MNPWRVENPCGEIILPMRPLVSYSLNHSTWRCPAYVYGIVYDVIRLVWSRRPAEQSTPDMESLEINDENVGRLMRDALALSRINFRDPDAINAWNRARNIVRISNHAMTSTSKPGHLDHWQRLKNNPRHLTYLDIRTCKRALDVNVNSAPAMLQSINTITEAEVIDFEATWRAHDAAWKTGKLTRRRREAFEAIWIAGEHAAAYAFLGSLYPPVEAQEARDEYHKRLGWP